MNNKYMFRLFPFSVTYISTFTSETFPLFAVALQLINQLLEVSVNDIYLLWKAGSRQNIISEASCFFSLFYTLYKAQRRHVRPQNDFFIWKITELVFIVFAQ